MSPTESAKAWMSAWVIMVRIVRVKGIIWFICVKDMRYRGCFMDLVDFMGVYLLVLIVI
jgi:hypothetical protein